MSQPYVLIYPLPLEPPSIPSSHFSRSSQSTELSSLFFYGKMQESGLIEIIHLIWISGARASILFFSILKFPQAALFWVAAVPDGFTFLV